MEEEKIKTILEREYVIKVKKIEKFRGSFKISTNERSFGLKVVKYKLDHFLFIISVIKHLKKRGSNEILNIINTKEGKEYITIDGNYCYLTDWLESRKSDYKNEEELQDIVMAIGRFHRLSEGFTIECGTKPRIGWFSWVKVFETRLNEILDFQNRIYQKAYKSEFDLMYLSLINTEIDIGKKAIEDLEARNYYKIMEKEVYKRGFCHHDLAYHNILIDKDNKIKFIDFDYCILDSKIHDISSVLIRVMKDGNWNRYTGEKIINSYKSENTLSDEEISLMKGFIKFPQSFWQIGLQYYWEQQPWAEDVFLSKINKCLENEKMREKFIKEFF